MLLVTGLAVFGLYKTKPEGTSLRQWITSDPYLMSKAFLGLLLLALLLLPWVVLALLAVAYVAWAGIRLLARPLRGLWREEPPLPALRTEQELIEQMHRDLELGRKARRASESTADES
jgi:hypothetical protein